MTQGPFEFSDLQKQLDKIYQINGFLPKLKSLIDFEIFRVDLQIVRDKERLSKAGRPPFDCVLMFKILVLKSLYNLSDEKIEEQIRDRISFRDFLDLSFTDTVPDAKTIWLFAETLKNRTYFWRTENADGNEILRSIGFARAKFWIGMRNLMSNMSRLVSLKKPKCAK